MISNRTINIVGHRFGRLTVLEQVNCEKTKRGVSAYWRCRCDCGNIKDIRTNNLTAGQISCGCLRGVKYGKPDKFVRKPRKVNAVKRNAPKFRLKDKQRRPEWLQLSNNKTGFFLARVWANMIKRCHDANDPAFIHYGARGITVCDRWRDRHNFLSDMGPSYRCGLQIDRIDNEGDYSPENCRWVTQSQNQRNKRNTRWITVGDKTASAAEWAEKLGVHRNMLYKWFKRGTLESNVMSRIACRDAEVQGNNLKLPADGLH